MFFVNILFAVFLYGASLCASNPDIGDYYERQFWNSKRAALNEPTALIATYWELQGTAHPTCRKG